MFSVLSQLALKQQPPLVRWQLPTKVGIHRHPQSLGQYLRRWRWWRRYDDHQADDNRHTDYNQDHDDDRPRSVRHQVRPMWRAGLDWTDLLHW